MIKLSTDCLTFKPDKEAKELARTLHREEQEMLFMFCTHFINECAKEDYRWDDRNRHAHELAQCIVDAYKKEFGEEESITF